MYRNIYNVSSRATGNEAKTREQIADEYSISTKTLNKWLKQTGIGIPRGLICPAHQKMIYELFGFPK